jgi:predicted TIM-barrel enzyme
VGEKPFEAKYDKEKTAALAVVVNTIFNFDESYMKR